VLAALLRPDLTPDDGVVKVDVAAHNARVQQVVLLAGRTTEERWLERRREGCEGQSEGGKGCPKERTKQETAEKTAVAAQVKDEGCSGEARDGCEGREVAQFTIEGAQ
jgi:hypothetical protein